jgi:hypothetical protein
VIRDTEFKATVSVYVGSHDNRVLCHEESVEYERERERERECVCVCVCVQHVAIKRKSDLMTHNSSCTLKTNSTTSTTFYNTMYPLCVLGHVFIIG